MLRVSLILIQIFLICLFSLSAQVTGEAIAQPVAGSLEPIISKQKSNQAKMSKEIIKNKYFEIVVSSYENNGVKTLIVTRNKNGSFHDRTEWVGKGEIPNELKSLMGKGELDPGGARNLTKSFFGVIVVDSRRTEGVDVKEVVGRSPAFNSGIRKGDLITGLNGKKIKDAEDLAKVLTQITPGEKVICRYFRGDRLAIEKVIVEEVPEGTGINLNAVDGGNVFAPPPNATIPSTSMVPAVGGISIRSRVENMPLTNYSAFMTPNKDWINIAFNAPPVPISVIVFDNSGKEIFHQHLPWFQGNYKQLIKIVPGIEGPFQVTVAQGGNVFSKEITME